MPNVEEDVSLKALMSPKQYEAYAAKIKAIQEASAVVIAEPATRSLRVQDREMVADRYELRYMSKKDIKKIPMEDLEALIVYWNIYTRKFDAGEYEGQFSFPEAEATHRIKGIICAMEQELSKRI